VARAGGGILVDDADFQPYWVLRELVPVLTDQERVQAMGRAAASVGVLDGSARMLELIRRAR